MFNQILQHQILDCKCPYWIHAISHLEPVNETILTLCNITFWVCKQAYWLYAIPDFDTVNEIVLTLCNIGFWVYWLQYWLYAIWFCQWILIDSTSIISASINSHFFGWWFQVYNLFCFALLYYIYTLIFSQWKQCKAFQL